MKLVFCGTPEFAVPTLRAVVEAGHEVSLVLTQPDRPAGRKMEIHTPPVKALALEFGLPVLQPEKIKTNLELRNRLEAIQPDAILVVAYGRIIPQWMLELPRFGNLNLHGSLLPKYRGAAPVQWAVANGENETGVTTMRLDSGLDTGDILLKSSVPIGPDTTAAQLFPQLSHIGAPLMLKTLEGLERGTLHAQVQDHSQASLAPILTRDDGKLDPLTQTAEVIYNRWRGFYPWPGAHATFQGKRFLIHKMHPLKTTQLVDPGLLDWSGGELLLGASEATAIVLDEVQLEGKPRLTGMDFVRGFQLEPGARLD